MKISAIKSLLHHLPRVPRKINRTWQRQFLRRDHFIQPPFTTDQSGKTVQDSFQCSSTLKSPKQTSKNRKVGVEEGAITLADDASDQCRKFLRQTPV